MENLSIIGHELGGITAISLASRVKSIKAVCTMDTWYFPYKDGLDYIVLNETPLFQIESEKYMIQPQSSEYDVEESSQ